MQETNAKCAMCAAIILMVCAPSYVVSDSWGLRTQRFEVELNEMQTYNYRCMGLQNRLSHLVAALVFGLKGDCEGDVHRGRGRGGDWVRVAAGRCGCYCCLLLPSIGRHCVRGAGAVSLVQHALSLGHAASLQTSIALLFG